MDQRIDKPDLSALRIQRDEPAVVRVAAGTSSRWRWAWVGALVVVALIAFVLFRSGGGAAVEVETAAVERLAPASAQSLLTASGYVVAQREAAVASKGTGRLEVLNVEEGDQVKAGEVIARLEATDVTASLESARAAVAQAQANLEQAKAVAHEAKLSFDRAQELLSRRLIAQSEYDNAQAQHETAEANVTAAEAAVASRKADVQWAEVQLENTYIRAPFDGTVLTKHADVGEVVAPFASSASSKGAVVTVADMSSLEVEADVSESNIQRIAVGQPCLITLDAFPAEPYRGRVKKVVPTADRSKATVMTKIAFDQLDSRVLPEMSAKVNFLPATGGDSASISTATVLAIPVKAVTQRDGVTVAFVVRQEQAYATPIRTGRTFGNSLEIEGGLQTGDVVVVSPPEALSDRGRIKLKQ